MLSTPSDLAIWYRTTHTWQISEHEPVTLVAKEIAEIDVRYCLKLSKSHRRYLPRSSIYPRESLLVDMESLEPSVSRWSASTG